MVGFSSKMGFTKAYHDVLTNAYFSIVSPCSNSISVVTAVKTNRQQGKNQLSKKIINKIYKEGPNKDAYFEYLSENEYKNQSKVMVTTLYSYQPT